jgi:predicted transcriptional regulator
MKNTKVKIVKAVMDANKNISVKEICEKTGLSKTQVYSARHQLNTTSKTKKKLTPVNKKVAKVDTNKALRAENEKLHQFCFEWRNKCDKQNLEIARIQHLYMDSQAVVRYLETKIEQLFKD